MRTYIFTHSKCSLAVIDADNFEAIKKDFVFDIPFVVIDSRSGSIIKVVEPLFPGSQELRGVHKSDERIAYILYTSGSTGIVVLQFHFL